MPVRVPITRCSLGAAALACVAAWAQPAARAAEPEGSCHALLVGGYPGSIVYARRYRDWLKRVRDHLTAQAGAGRCSVVVLSDDDGLTDPPARAKPSAETVAEAFEQFATQVRPADQFVLVLVGHGSITTDPPTLVVRGPDLDAGLFARGLAQIRARNQVVVNLTSSAGASVRHLSAKGRVNLAANSAAEGVEPVFAEFLLRGLESARADGMGAPEAGEADGVVTLLEAYNWATYQTALWISRLSYEQESSSWRVDGRESVEIFEKLCTGPEGVLGARRLSAASRRDVPDQAVRIRPGREIPYSWEARRAITEHASLEDCGEEVGVSALNVVEIPEARVQQAWDVEPAEPEGSDPREFVPLAGRKRDEPGHLARRVVLGRPGLLPQK